MRRQGMTIQKATECLGIAHSLTVDWKKQWLAWGGDDPIIPLIKSKKKATHAGLLGQLKSIEANLLHAIFELREPGVMVSTFLISTKASLLSSAFNAKSFMARCSSARHLMHARLFVYPMDTHKLQCKPEEVEREAKDCMHLIWLFVIGNHHDPRFILNMD
jgi:hypothetical protein